MCDIVCVGGDNVCVKIVSGDIVCVERLCV